jgi:hypothetical protein
MATLTYARYCARYTEEFPTLEEALAFARHGSDAGDMWPISIQDGERIYSSTHPLDPEPGELNRMLEEVRGESEEDSAPST